MSASRPISDLTHLVDRFDAALPVEEASMPPSAWYTDAAVYELEQRAVFGRAWQPVAALAELSRAGDYRAGCTAQEPWVITRSSDGELRAHANTCRHKGREIVTGHGNAPTLRCGYHAWEYDLGGRLVRAPKVAGIRNFDRDAMALPALGVQAWGPWAWLNLDRDAPSHPAWGPLGHTLDAGGWNRLRLHSRVQWTIECNWKVYVDNYLDGGYHIPHMHPSLDAQLDMKGYRTELYDDHSIQSSPPAAADHERIGKGALYAWMYPNFMLNRYGPCLDTNHVIPLGPGRCRVDYEFYFADLDDAASTRDAREFCEQSIEQAAVTQREDIEICESVQRGLRSQSYDTGRYAPRLEHGEHHFHRRLAADLRRGLGF